MPVTEEIRVGLIGASIPRNGWAVRAHAPALAALDGFRIHAVATSRRESADEAGRVLGAEHAFASADDLIACDEVDLVVVGVRVLDHAAIVRPALVAGRHVLCEWPLGAGAAETAELTALGRSAGVVHAVGVQARAAPALRHAAQLVADGYVGELQSVLLTASNPQPGGRELPAAWAWHANRESWLSPLTSRAGMPSTPCGSAPVTSYRSPPSSPRSTRRLRSAREAPSSARRTIMWQSQGGSPQGRC